MNAALERRARQHLARVHPVFQHAIKVAGPCTLVPDPDAFAVLTRFVVYQQISTKAAASICGRLTEQLGSFRPEVFVAASDEDLRLCGLSTPKRRTIRALCDHLQTHPDTLMGLEALSDAEVAARLLPIRGIGPWTVDMFLMFGLGRPDVLPVGDLGLRVGVRDLFGLPTVPSTKEVTALAESWRPYRSVATWYVWRSRGVVPQSGDHNRSTFADGR